MRKIILLIIIAVILQACVKAPEHELKSPCVAAPDGVTRTPCVRIPVNSPLLS